MGVETRFEGRTGNPAEDEGCRLPFVIDLTSNDDSSYGPEAIESSEKSDVER